MAPVIGSTTGFPLRSMYLVVTNSAVNHRIWCNHEPVIWQEQGQIASHLCPALNLSASYLP